MSLWQRFKRALRSIFGGWVSEMEDPALILEQNIRDMRDKIPKMNENIAMLRANAKMVEKEKAKLEGEQAKITANIKAAIGQSREDIAAEYALQLEHNKTQVAKLEQQLEQAKAAAEKGEEAKAAFMKELDRKTKEALDAIETAKRAKWQKEVADTMEQFTAGGVDHTHDEMVKRIEKDSAMSEARLDMAVSKGDKDKAKIEADAEKIRAAELVKQFKIEMGVTDSSGGSQEKTGVKN
ncbi:MAG TPA: PspA/IM30 family protein [Turneriella sp.]|nr:PspA/IM30 family protein [Turneriella sp.]HNE20892.1 PspA/IM30 family protein [Turneriella sp.]HNJ66954.1 PspA/IM30 family protein [Turneriella sp.]HNL09576.1 PspA/IM30 family protein [Turneriella sp.]